MYRQHISFNPRPVVSLKQYLCEYRHWSYHHTLQAIVVAVVVIESIYILLFEYKDD